MRILIVSDLHWPNINGIATFGRNLAAGLADAGHEVAVIAPSQNLRRHVEHDGNHKVYRTTSLIFPFYQNLRISPSPYFEVNKIINEFKPDVIHVQTPLGIGIAAITAAKRYHIPLVATNHAMSENLIDNLKLLAPFARPIDRILRAMVGRIYDNADFITLPTEAAITMFGSESIARPHAAISNGIDLSRFRPGRVPKAFAVQYGIPTDVPVIMYLGRLDSEKHVSVLLRAAERLKDKYKFHLVVIGDGNDLSHLEELARDLDIANAITFTGRVDELDKQQLLRLGAIFTMPSPAELQSIATLEAMASGMPVVAVNAGALYELCQEGTNGYLFEVDDDEGMALGLERLMKDTELRSQMSERSIEIAQTHDLKETIKRFEEVYTKVTGVKADPEKVLTEVI